MDDRISELKSRQGQVSFLLCFVSGKQTIHAKLLSNIQMRFRCVGTSGGIKLIRFPLVSGTADLFLLRMAATNTEGDK